MHMIRPVPNINGTPANDLANQMVDVVEALDHAMEVMRKWQPHGRDYQIGGDYQADHAEYMRRHLVLSEMADQYQAEARRCMDYYYKLGKGVRT